MAPPNNASCISDHNLNTATSLGSSYLTQVLRPATLDSIQIAVEMGSPKKRKPDPEIQNNDKSAKRMRKSKKDTQMIIQMEIEEVNALERENKELEEEEMKQKKVLQEMRNVYMDFIKNGQIVFVDNPTPTSRTTSASSQLGETSPVANLSQMTAQHQTIGQITPVAVTPPSTPQDVVFDSMSANSIPSMYGHDVGYSNDPSSSAVQCLHLPVIQCTSNQWATPPSPENNVPMSPQPGPFLAMESVSNDISSQMPTSWQHALVTVENIDLDSFVILPFEDIPQSP
jgi:hypothetical protein